MLRKFKSYEQIAHMLRHHDGGIKRTELASRYGVTKTTISRWTVPYAGLTAEWIKTVTKLRHQLYWATRHRRQLERILQASTDVIKQFQPSARKRSRMNIAVRAKYDFNCREANRALGICEKCNGKSTETHNDELLINMMKDYFLENPGQGFFMVFKALLENEPCTKRHAHQVYTQCGLRIKERNKEKLPVPSRISKPMKVQGQPDNTWSMDFVFDVLPSAKRYCVLNVIDDFSREAVLTRVLQRHTAQGVVEALEDLRLSGRKPSSIRTDNGGEFKSLAYLRWTKRNNISCIHIRPGKPYENSYVERFNRTFRSEVLGRYKFKSILEAQRMADDWRIRYNLSRPNRALGGLSPVQYAHAVKIGSLEGLPQKIGI